MTGPTPTLDVAVARPAPGAALLRPLLWAGGVLAVLAAAAHLVDAPLVAPLDFHRANLDGEDWYRLLRVVGFIGTWVAVALVIALADGPRRPSRWPFVLLAPLLAGAVAEGLKLIVRRGRPDAHAEHLHVLWPGPGSAAAADWSPSLWGWTPANPPPWGALDGPLHVPGWWDASDFGIPSSHAAVAFAGLAALWVLFPRAWPVLLALGVGCGITRMISRAHYLSDTLAGAAIGVLAAAVLVWLSSRRAGSGAR